MQSEDRDDEFASTPLDLNMECDYGVLVDVDLGGDDDDDDGDGTSQDKALQDLAWPRGYMLGTFFRGICKTITFAIARHQVSTSVCPIYPPTGSPLRSSQNSQLRSWLKDWQTHEQDLANKMASLGITTYRAEIVSGQIVAAFSWGSGGLDRTIVHLNADESCADETLAEQVVKQSAEESWPLNYMLNVWVPRARDQITAALKRSRSCLRLSMRHPVNLRKEWTKRAYTSRAIQSMAQQVKNVEPQVQAQFPTGRLSELKTDDIGFYYMFYGDAVDNKKRFQNVWKPRNGRCNIM